MAGLNCLMCNKPSAKNCTTCKSARYCSKACQESDWPVHTFLCKKLTKLSPRPKKPSKLAILLSADDPNPKLIWVPCPNEDPSYFLTRHLDLSIHGLLGSPTPSHYEPFTFGKNEVRGYQMDHQVVLYARDNWLNDGSKPNQAALALTDGRLAYDWRGNILVMSYSLKNIPMTVSESFLDVTLEDLRAAADFLSIHGKEFQRGREHEGLRLVSAKPGEEPRDDGLAAHIERMELEHQNKKVKGVVFRCNQQTESNLRSNGGLRYSAMMISTADPIWGDRPLEFSTFIGLPLLMRKVTASSRTGAEDDGLENLPTAFLNLSINPSNAQIWGKIAEDWNTNIDDVLVVRKDGRDLSPEQGWAFAEFMRSQVFPAFAKIPDAGNISQRRATVLKMVNWSKFDAYLEKLKADMAPANKPWVGVRSPFGTREDRHGNLW